MSNIKRKSYIFGIFTENIAKLFLTICFYRILESRYKTKFGEIDLIVKRGNLVAFVEVKGRKSKKNIHETITNHQKKRIIQSSNYFLMKNKVYGECYFRYDAFLFSPPLFIKYIKNAFQC